MEKYEDALNMYKKCQNLVPSDDQLSINIGLCLIKLNQNEEALKVFSDALKINPNNKFAIHYRNKLSKYVNV